MYQINLQKPCTAYFIGIGGISMSGFAKLLHENGFTVRGSDSQESKITKHLASLGISIVYGQSSGNITKDIDFIVYTAAISPDNPEFIAAKQLNIPMLSRASMVGQVMKNYKNAIGISGTHGKTTTTSMLAHIFLTAGKDPTISVGGILDAIQGNIRIGHSENFITEACEYTNSFLEFFPTAEIILNIEADHLDFFKDIDDIRHSFYKYASLLSENGVLVINSEIPDYKEITAGLPCKVITFGLNREAEYSAADIAYNEKGQESFELVHNGIRTGDKIILNVGGEHNVSNALSVIALSLYYGISIEQIKEGLLSFNGTKRRFEVKGSFNGVTVIDDYAHHPTEIKATLQTAERFPTSIYGVYSSHTPTAVPKHF